MLNEGQRVALRLPPTFVSRLKDKLDDLRRLHDRDVARLAQRIKSGAGTPQKLEEARVALAERSRRLTLNNLFRIAAEAGLRSGPDDGELLELLAREGTAIGRPRRG